MPPARKQLPPRTPATVARPNDLPGDAVSRIRPIQFDEDGIKILITGRSGTGKTTLWGTFPGPILAIITSGGLKPGELRSLDTPELRKKVSAVTLHSTDEMPALINHVKTNGRYATVVMDHVTGYQDLVLKEILGLSEIPVQKSWGMARQDQYGQAVQQCKEAFRHLLNLDGNVVLVGQDRGSREEVSSEVMTPTVGVALMPSLAGWLNPAVDYIVQTFIRTKEVEKVGNIAGQEVKTMFKVKGEVEYCLRTGPDEVYVTKFRVPRGSHLPAIIVDPDYDKLYQLIKGTKQ